MTDKKKKKMPVKCVIDMLCFYQLKTKRTIAEYIKTIIDIFFYIICVWPFNCIERAGHMAIIFLPQCNCLYFYGILLFLGGRTLNLVGTLSPTNYQVLFFCVASLLVLGECKVRRAVFT